MTGAIEMVTVDDVPCHLVEVGTRTGPSVPGEPVYEAVWMTQADLEAAQQAAREQPPGVYPWRKVVPRLMMEPGAVYSVIRATQEMQEQYGQQFEELRAMGLLEGHESEALQRFGPEAVAAMRDAPIERQIDALDQARYMGSRHGFWTEAGRAIAREFAVAVDAMVAASPAVTGDPVVTLRYAPNIPYLVGVERAVPVAHGIVRRYVAEDGRGRFSAKNAAVGAAFGLADRLGLPLYVEPFVGDVTIPAKYGGRVTLTRDDPTGMRMGGA